MPVDYDALAAQHGGTAQIDYDALAAQHGGTVQAPPPAPPDTRSLFQKAKDNFNANTQGAAPGDGAVLGAVKNFGAGAGDVVRSLAHPIDTLEGMAKSITPDPGIKGLGEAALGPAGAFLVHNAQAAAQNPARFAGQVGAGALLGEAVGPVVGAGAEMLKRGASKAVLLGKTPAGAYESAMKPSPALSATERAAIVKTGLENEIPVSKAGVEKISERIEALNQAIKDEISADPTRPIDPNAVATRSADARARFAKQVNAQPDLNAIEASKQQFLDEQGAKPGTPATPTGLLDAQGRPIMRPAQPPTPAPPMNAIDAQEMKQGTYKVLKGKFGEQGSASVEAQKSLARGLKEEIATQFPEIDKLNAEESRLLDLQPILERAVNRISNHQAIGIGTPVAGAAAKAVTGSGSVGVVASTLKAVLDNPMVKSRLAIAVSKASKVPISQAMARVQAYSVSLGSIAGGSQAYSSADNPNQPTTPQP